MNCPYCQGDMFKGRLWQSIAMAHDYSCCRKMLIDTDLD